MIREAWVWILDPTSGEPWWFRLPAVSQTAVTSPRLLDAFDGYNDSVHPEARIRPFNFSLSAQVAEFGHPEGVDRTRFHLIAPYEEDPNKYLGLPWIDRFTGTAYRITVEDDFGASGAVLVVAADRVRGNDDVRGLELRLASSHPLRLSLADVVGGFERRRGLRLKRAEDDPAGGRAA
jgi:hypothetical protein